MRAWFLIHAAARSLLIVAPIIFLSLNIMIIKYRVGIFTLV